jgi:hypothetical protein
MFGLPKRDQYLLGLGPITAQSYEFTATAGGVRAKAIMGPEVLFPHLSRREDFSNRAPTHFAGVLIIWGGNDIHPHASMAFDPPPHRSWRFNGTRLYPPASDPDVMQFPAHEKAQNREKMRNEHAIQLDTKWKSHCETSHLG